MSVGAVAEKQVYIKFQVGMRQRSVVVVDGVLPKEGRVGLFV